MNTFLFAALIACAPATHSEDTSDTSDTYYDSPELVVSDFALELTGGMAQTFTIWAQVPEGALFEVSSYVYWEDKDHALPEVMMGEVWTDARLVHEGCAFFYAGEYDGFVLDSNEDYEVLFTVTDAYGEEFETLFVGEGTMSENAIADCKHATKYL